MSFIVPLYITMSYSRRQSLPLLIRVPPVRTSICTHYSY